MSAAIFAPGLGAAKPKFCESIDFYTKNEDLHLDRTTLAKRCGYDG